MEVRIMSVYFQVTEECQHECRINVGERYVGGGFSEMSLDEFQE
jgi:hypothetical protein